MRSGPVAGSPLLPAGFGIFVLLLLAMIYLIVHLASRHNHPREEIRKFVFWSVLSVLSLITFICIYLAQPPMVLSKIPSSDVRASISGPVSIEFSVPVKRATLEKSVSPDVPGVWIFENPVYATHLYRKVTFYPDFGLNSSTKYTVNLNNIQNVLGFGITRNYTFSFTTVSAPIMATSQLTKVESQTMKLPVPVYLQQHTLSCEAASLRMAIAYKGINKTEDELLNAIGYDMTPHVNGIWGDPYVHFVGNVDGRQMRDGYGVYWGPIESVARSFGNAQAFEHGDIKMLTDNIKKGYPVIIWTYSKNGSPTHWKTPGGKDIYAVSGEHTVVVVGFVGPSDNPTQIVVNDSLNGQVYWPRSYFDQKWSVFGESGVIVFK